MSARPSSSASSRLPLTGKRRYESRRRKCQRRRASVRPLVALVVAPLLPLEPCLAWGRAHRAAIAVSARNSYATSPPAGRSSRRVRRRAGRPRPRRSRRTACRPRADEPSASAAQPGHLGRPRAGANAGSIKSMSKLKYAGASPTRARTRRPYSAGPSRQLAVGDELEPQRARLARSGASRAVRACRPAATVPAAGGPPRARAGTGPVEVALAVVVVPRVRVGVQQHQGDAGRARPPGRAARRARPSGRRRARPARRLPGRAARAPRDLAGGALGIAGSDVEVAPVHHRQSPEHVHVQRRVIGAQPDRRGADRLGAVARARPVAGRRCRTGPRRRPRRPLPDRSRGDSARTCAAPRSEASAPRPGGRSGGSPGAAYPASAAPPLTAPPPPRAQCAACGRWLRAGSRRGRGSPARTPRSRLSAALPGARSVSPAGTSRATRPRSGPPPVDRHHLLRAQERLAGRHLERPPRGRWHQLPAPGVTFAGSRVTACSSASTRRAALSVAVSPIPNTATITFSPASSGWMSRSRISCANR